MQKFNVDAPSSSSHGRTEIRRFGVRSIAPSPLDRPAGIASRPSMDDAGALRTDANRRLTKAEDEYASTTTTHRRSVRGGDCADVEHAMEIALRRRIKRETARAYREALDEQIRARDAKFVGSSGARRFNTAGGHVPALGERAMNVVDDGWTSQASAIASAREAKAENEERRRQRDAYVAALDAQVAERRERARREKEAREKADREEDARIAAAIEEERAVLEEKRALMARSAAASGENASSVSATSVRKPRVTHSPPASPRPLPRVPPIHVDDDDDVDEGYQPIPEFPDDDDTVTTDPSSTCELVAIIRELVVERSEMSRRLADAEARIARLQRRQQQDDDDDI